MKKSFLIGLILVYLASLILALFSPESVIVMVLRLSAVVFAIVFVCVKFPKDNALKLALFLTLLADILLVSRDFLLAGVIVFCLAQFCHLIRLSITTAKPTARFATKPTTIKPLVTSLSVLPFYSAFIATVIIASIVCGLEPIFSAAIIYGTTLVANLVFSVVWYRHRPSAHSLCAICGFTLFILCDLAVGISFLGSTSVFPATITPIMNYLAWVFYFPSQILLANSSKL